jgi:hypothetical protein
MLRSRTRLPAGLTLVLDRRDARLLSSVATTRLEVGCALGIADLAEVLETGLGQEVPRGKNAASEPSYKDRISWRMKTT